MSIRLAPLGLAVAILVAGCTLVGAERTAPPERPDDLTEQTVVTFVEAYEEAHHRNRIVDRYSPDSASVVVTSARVVNESRPGYVVHLDVEFFTHKGNNAGHGVYTAAYFVNETTIMRDRGGTSSDAPLAPRNGTVVGT